MASSLTGWIILLCVSQIGMFIFTKQAAQKASLPLLICLAQFATSAVLTALISVAPGAGNSGRHPLSRLDRSLWTLVVPLGVVWALGFVLLTASVARMSAALAGGVVRSMEPLASVALGFFLGERNSLQVAAALLPISAGVVLAAYGGGSLNASGTLLAMVSNFAFSARPFLAKRLKGHEVGKKLDDVEVFLAVMCVAVSVLPFAVAVVEGQAALSAARRLWAAGDGGRFLLDTLLSGLGFFMYQFAQLRVMSQLAPLTFSVLTPISKAFMIIACALYFGDPFGATNLAGVGVATAGVLLFAMAKRADAKKAAVSAKKES